MFTQSFLRTQLHNLVTVAISLNLHSEDFGITGKNISMSILTSVHPSFNVELIFEIASHMIYTKHCERIR